jgi:hypothetical protein
MTPATIKCTITNKHYDLNNEQRMWIEKGNDQTESKYNATVPLVGKSNNFTAGMDGCPTLIEFMKFGEHHVNIIEKIGATYHNFGTLLLEDTDGSIMGALEGEKRGNAEDINNAVLTRWIRGEGRKPTSWATLVTVLEQCQLHALADMIRSVMATPGMDDCPTLNDLMNFGKDHVNIIEEIGATYHKFGTFLLEDKPGGSEEKAGSLPVGTH